MTIEDETYRFVVDTTANFSVFGPALSQHIGERLPKMTLAVNGLRRDLPFPERFKAPMGTLGRRPIRFEYGVQFAGLETIRKALGLPIDGILGMDVLRDLIVELDFANGKLRLLAAVPSNSGASLAIQRTDGWPSSIPIHRLMAPALDLELPGIGVKRLTLHTFMDNDLVLSWSTIDELEAAGQITGRTELPAAAGEGEKIGVIGHVDRLPILNQELRNLTVARCTSSGSAKSADVEAIGLGVLARFLVTLDFPANRFHWKSRAPGHEWQSYSSIGCNVVRCGPNRIAFEGIACEGQAARVGLLAGDLILAIDGKPHSDLRIAGIRSMLIDCKGPVTVTVQREGQSAPADFVISAVSESNPRDR